MSAALEHLSELFLPAIEAEMKAVLASDDPRYQLYYGMMHYHLGWADQQLGPAAGQVGKRIRPLVCLLVCDAGGGDWERAVPAAAAIELLHNFSLIHDDIEDDSETRRGRKAVWAVWGITQAINAGDSMFASAFEALARLVDRGVEHRTVAEALRVFTHACTELTKGQHLDICYESQTEVTADQYLGMIAGKTAALISATAEIGAIVADATPEHRRHYAEFGRNLGLAFQAYDDVLGVWGDELSLGKSTASDLLNRKKTLAVVYGLAQSAELRELFGKPEIDVPRAVELLDSIGARQYALSTAHQYSDAAIADLEAAAAAGKAGEALRQLTAELIRRDK